MHTFNVMITEPISRHAALAYIPTYLCSCSATCLRAAYLILSSDLKMRTGKRGLRNKQRGRHLDLEDDQEEQEVKAEAGSGKARCGTKGGHQIT